MSKSITTTPEYNIGLALSGGGAKGIAHAGVIKALIEHDLKPEIISAVSAGAIVGALYADGKSPEDILGFFKEAKFSKYMNITIPKLGLLPSNRYEKLLRDYMSAKTFEDLSIPLYINATELKEGKNVFFNSGSLVDKIVASSSVPIIFRPRMIEGKMYVDGGIFNNMPCSIIRDKCKLLAGCHLSPIQKEGELDGVFDVAERVYELSIQSSAVVEKRFCDIVFEPVNPKDFGLFDVSLADKLFDIGYSSVMHTLDDNHDLIHNLIGK